MPERRRDHPTTTTSRKKVVDDGGMDAQLVVVHLGSPPDFGQRVI